MANATLSAENENLISKLSGSNLKLVSLKERVHDKDE
jgi:hypothetical protein